MRNASEPEWEPSLNWNYIFNPQMSFTQIHSITQLSFQLFILKNGGVISTFHFKKSGPIHASLHFSLHIPRKILGCICACWHVDSFFVVIWLISITVIENGFSWSSRKLDQFFLFPSGAPNMLRKWRTWCFSVLAKNSWQKNVSLKPITGAEYGHVQLLYS